MKLARPDLFHPRIVLAGPGKDASPGKAGWPGQVRSGEDEGEDAGLVGALRRRGLQARWLPWDDPATEHADLVIVRATGGYRQRLESFLAWTRRVSHLLNAPDVIAWNADERYLGDLQRAGVPTGGAPEACNPTALVFLCGGQSHAFAGDSPVEPDFELWDVGRAALAAAADHLGIRTGALLYARADVTGDPGEARLVSLDVIAPSLGWGLLDGGAREVGQRQFALCVESALERLGLGPFSHRRP
ncbi:hypothetical protein MSM1_14370 [Mycobacterium sp. SM1]|uniref:hypothetical protein n=1 Tax=Mycobacterium sp. SM1 TaxID=2816243 RepID=UPI001BD14A36|nr:hypothetical protein [Mycobacterium sp. SM1]MBS4729476.1 hypothetical protein [Mycobacterium sp. SM1]